MKSTFTITIFSIFLLTFIFIGGCFYGNFLTNNGTFNSLNKSLKANLFHIVNRKLNKRDVQPKELHIKITENNYNKLQKKVNNAMKFGMILRENNSSDYVPADIEYNNKTKKAKIRLKGGALDHVNGKKWSFRIKLKGDNTLMGMKTFSVQDPATRNYISEWIFFKLLKQEKLIALRYEFVRIFVNGEDKGIYALEESFDSRLIENNQNRIGPIVKFDEKASIKLKMNVSTSTPEFKNKFTESYLTSNIDAFQSGKTAKDSVLMEQFKIAVTLIEKFRKNELTTSEVFDTDILAKYMALVDITGSYHAEFWVNKRFYYNPITAKLEPIGYDANAGRGINQLLYSMDLYNTIHHNSLFNDTAFLRKYIYNLEHYSRNEFMTDFFKSIENDLEDNLSVLYSEYLLYNFDKNVFEANKNLVKSILNPEKAVQSYVSGIYNDTLILSIGNNQSLPIELVDITYKNNVISPLIKYLIPGKKELSPMSYVDCKFVIPSQINTSKLEKFKIHYKVFGLSKIIEGDIYNWPYEKEYFIEKSVMHKKPNISEFPFIQLNNTNKTIQFISGKYDIYKDIIIPPGFSVLAYKGLELNLAESVSIISYSNIRFLGDDDSPIIIQSRNSKGQGFFVLNTKKPSQLENVIFNNLSNPFRDGWSLTGAVNFYNSKVAINNCTFTGNRSECGLNIIRSEFNLKNTTFSSMQSDAFDSDFSNGTIHNCRFLDCGNDGLNLSGSFVDIYNSFFENIGGKAMSAGEKSNVKANQIEVRNAKFGFTVKDCSEASIFNTSITESKIGYVLYQKKSEFGPAKLKLDILQLEDVEKSYLIEINSKMTIGNELLEPTTANVTNAMLNEM